MLDEWEDWLCLLVASYTRGSAKLVVLESSGRWSLSLLSWCTTKTRLKSMVGASCVAVQPSPCLVLWLVKAVGAHCGIVHDQSAAMQCGSMVFLEGPHACAPRTLNCATCTLAKILILTRERCSKQMGTTERATVVAADWPLPRTVAGQAVSPFYLCHPECMCSCPLRARPQ